MANLQDASSQERQPVAEDPTGWIGLFTRHFVLANETTRFILVNALDFFVTYLLLSWPDSSAYEANPIAQKMVALGLPHLIAFKFGMATVSVVCCELVARRRPGVGRFVLNSLMLIVSGVVVYGVWLIARHLTGIRFHGY